MYAVRTGYWNLCRPLCEYGGRPEAAMQLAKQWQVNDCVEELRPYIDRPEAVPAALSRRSGSEVSGGNSSGERYRRDSREDGAASSDYGISKGVETSSELRQGETSSRREHLGAHPSYPLKAHAAAVVSSDAPRPSRQEQLFQDYYGQVEEAARAAKLSSKSSCGSAFSRNSSAQSLVGCIGIAGIGN